VAVNDIVPAVGEYLDETLAAASPDLLRTMIREFAQRMMDAEVRSGTGGLTALSHRVSPASPGVTERSRSTSDTNCSNASTLSIASDSGISLETGPATGVLPVVD
jgi:hypothetical protein